MGTSRTDLAIAKYRKQATRYDSTTHRTEPIRRRAVASLELRPGDVVLDVACGTGLSFHLIEAGIGPAGRLIGIEQCPEMVEIARRRVETANWANITLIESPVEEATIPVRVDAILFSYTHDVLRSQAALENIFHKANPGARVVAAGMKYLSWWLAPANLYILFKAYPYVTTLEGLGKPWSLLEEHVPNIRVTPVFMGGGYIVSGRSRG